MINYNPKDLSFFMRDTLVKAAKAVRDNFGKSLDELSPEYKADGPKSVRTAIDTHAEKIMKSNMRQAYPDAIFNLEEEGVSGEGDLEGRLLIFGDPFDGTANAQPKLPLSTQGLMAAQNGEYIAAAALHPFEGDVQIGSDAHVLFGSKGNGVFRAELDIDSEGNYSLTGEIRPLPHLLEQFERLKREKEPEHTMMAIDAYPNPVNFCAERKLLWTAEVIERLDKDHGGPLMCKMIRATGSNIDYCMKLAEGRLHIQNTDFVGGIYDVAAAAVFLPELGGVMTDMYGQKLKTPKTKAEMKTPSQQVLFASINPEIQPVLVEAGLKYYGENARIYMPRYDRFISSGIEYPGAGKWDKTHLDILNSLR